MTPEPRSRIPPPRAALARRAAAALAALALACAWLPQVRADQPTDARVKAAFLFKFCGYIDWKGAGDKSKPLVIGVMGNDDVAAELAAIVPGRNVNGRPVAARRLKPSDPLDGIGMLFIGAGTDSPARVAERAEKKGVLVVSEGEDGLLTGSAINFVIDNDRVGFEVSLPAAERSGHDISARLLAVARRVLRDGA
jgi:hypothetical protein